MTLTYLDRNEIFTKWNFRIRSLLITFSCMLGLIGCSNPTSIPSTSVSSNMSQHSHEIVSPIITDQNIDSDTSYIIANIPEESTYDPPISPLKFESLTFNTENYPELDFGIWSHDNGYMIRDFAFTPKNTILLLQMPGIISEYDFSGKLLGVYDYKLSEHGFTAFRICAGLQDVIYLLDGHNNSVLTCNREEVIQSSHVDWNDLGLAKNYFECNSNGIPCLSATHPSLKVSGNVSASFTYALNVDDERTTIEETFVGCGLAGGITFQISKLGESLGTRELTFDIYSNGTFDCRISVSTNSPEDLSIIGADILGIINNQYLIKIIEVKCTADSTQEYITTSYLLIDTENKVFYICECSIPDNAIIRYIDDKSFFLSRKEDSISIVSIDNAYFNLTQTDYFVISVSN